MSGIFGETPPDEQEQQPRSVGRDEAPPGVREAADRILFQQRIEDAMSRANQQGSDDSVDEAAEAFKLAFRPIAEQYGGLLATVWIWNLWGKDAFGSGRKVRFREAYALYSAVSFLSLAVWGAKGLAEYRVARHRLDKARLMARAQQRRMRTATIPLDPGTSKLLRDILAARPSQQSEAGG